MTSAFPRSFGRYTLISNLAQGGMGALYLACQGDTGMEKLCVIKTVLPQLADKEYLARFRDEAKVVVKLSHGNVVPVFDAGRAGGLAGEEMYVAMEYVEGKDLRAVWNRCAQKGIAFPVDVGVFITLSVCRGLHHAHSVSRMKLVHRDVSPPNVLLSFGGEVKITDFGLATSTMKTEKTAPGVVYGKVSYMSPEQARGEALDGRTDLFAAGVILWELLSGRQLFPQSEPRLIERVRDPRIEPPSKFAARVPPALDAIVMKALAKDKTLRYADCEAFRAALAGFLAETAPTTDGARIAAFLAQLFEGDIERERGERQRLLDEASEWAAEKRAAPAVPEPMRSGSQPLTAPLSPKAPQPASGAGLVGTYIDGRYLIKGILGEGGMGLVYEAEHVEIGRRVAVKVLHAMYTRQTEVLGRFRSEARAATRIGHPHIIDVFDSGTTVDGAVYFVMEFLEGRDLAQLLEETGRLPPERSIMIAREVCYALAAAHRAGILHRDLKPENVFLIKRDGNPDFVKVLDFGIAKTLDVAPGRAGRVTNPGVAMGTPQYMAPEQAAGLPVDARADVYAIGAMLYEMLSGEPPHDGGNVLELLTRKATVPPRPLEELVPGVPRALAALVMRTLSINAEVRPQSMEAMAEELTKLEVAPPPATTLPHVETEKVPRTRSAYVAAGVLAALAVIGVTWWGVSALSGRAGRRVVVVSPSPNPPTPPGTGTGTGTETETGTGTGTGTETGTGTATETVAAPKLITVDKAVVLKPKAAPPKAPAPASPALQVAEARAILREAREAMANERYKEAEELFNRVRATGLEEAASLLGLAEVAFQRGSYAQAMHLGQRAVAAGGGIAAKMVLGNACLKLGRYDDAINQYREVLRVNGGHVEARSNLAVAEKRKGS